MTEDPDSPIAGFEKRCQHAKCGGLARPVRADQAKALPLVHGERQVGDRHEVAIDFTQPLSLNRSVQSRLFMKIPPKSLAHNVSKRSDTANSMKTDHRKQLIEDGFCVFESVLEDKFVDQLCELTDRLLDEQPEEHFRKHQSTGSLVSIFEDSFFIELIGCSRALEAFASLGYERPKFQSGYIISKPPQSPPLFWHQDWWGWDNPCSAEPTPQQVFFMYYLVDTCQENGCLRVIPGSHLKHHQMHDIVSLAHTDEALRMADPNHPGYKKAPNEIDVPVKAGDLVIGDSRMLHAAHANQSNQRRTVITLWFHPEFEALPESVQSHIVTRHPMPEPWASQARSKINHLLPTYDGNTQPLKENRHPSTFLKSQNM